MRSLGVAILLLLTGCASVRPPIDSLPQTSEEFLAALVGDWDARSLSEARYLSARLHQDGIALFHGLETNDAAGLGSPADQSIYLQFRIDDQSGRLIMRDPKASHPLLTELCHVGTGTWKVCGNPGNWRFRFASRDLIQVGGTASPPGEMRRIGKGRVF